MAMKSVLHRAVLATALLLPSAAHARARARRRQMDWPWALPFPGILLSIATGPLLFAKFWHAHYGKIASAWAALDAARRSPSRFGAPAALAAFVHAVLAEYMGFIVLLFALYVVAGGILITGNCAAARWPMPAFSASAPRIASIVGTTGAAMILVRPLIRANAARKYNTHVVIFFIFLVANIGGALSPLGDPPLFVGFLRGVDFFWTASISATRRRSSPRWCWPSSSRSTSGSRAANRKPRPPPPSRCACAG